MANAVKRYTKYMIYNYSKQEFNNPLNFFAMKKHLNSVQVALRFKATLLKRTLVVFLLAGAYSTAFAQSITISTGTTSNISSSTSGGVVTYSLTNTGANGVLNVSDIETQLNASNSVTVNAVLDLIVSNALTWTSSNKLTLTAGRYMRVNANITSSTGNGPAEFQGATGLSVGATSNVRISTGSGDITFISDWIAFDGFLTSPSTNTTTIATTGTLSVVPFNNSFDANTMGGSDGVTGSGFEWTGTLSNGDFTSGNDFKNLIIENYASLGGLVVGKQGSTNNVYIADDISIAGPITLYGGSVNLRANLETTLANGDILLHANGNISTTDNWSITTGGGDVRLESTGTIGASNITLGTGISIASSGGNVSVSMRTGSTANSAYANLKNLSVTTNGGSFTTTGLTSYTASVAALELDGASISTGAGNISLFGNAFYTTATESNVWGVRILNASSLSATTGDITISGLLRSPAASTTVNARAVLIAGTSSVQTTGSGNITITGEIPSTSTADPSHVVQIQTTGTVSSGGDLTITGNNLGSSSVKGFETSTALSSAGNLQITGTSIDLAANLSTTSNGSTLTLTATGAIDIDGSSSRTITTANGAVQILADSDANGSGTYWGGGLTVNPGSGNVLVRGAVIADEAQTINGTGTLTIEPSAASFASAFTLNNIATASTLTSLQLGKSGNTANITVSTARTVAGPITLYAGDIRLEASLSSTAAGAAILLQATGDISTSYSTTTARTISTTNGDLSIIADSDANGSGHLNLDYTTFSAGTGNVVIRGETVGWTVGGSATPTITSTTGGFTFESSDASFGQYIETGWFNFPSTLSSFTIGKSTNTEYVGITVNALGVAGPITLYGGDIDLYDLTVSSATGDIKVLATGNITDNSSLTHLQLTTQGGDILLAADVDGSGGGYILIDEATGSSTTERPTFISNGGDITLAGGDATGSGFAKGISTYQRGIALSGPKIYSSNGNITIKGESYGYNNGVYFGIANDPDINSGTGSVYIHGKQSTESHTGTNTHALHFAAPNFTSITSANTTDTAITIIGEGIYHRGISATNEIRITATGSATGGNGGIYISGQRGSSFSYAVEFNAGYILSHSGPIEIEAKNDPNSTTNLGFAYLEGVTLGSMATTSVTASTANVTLTSDVFQSLTSTPTSINTDGTFTVRPYQSSFGSTQYFNNGTQNALQTNYFTLNGNSQTLTGLTLGKPGNTAAVTISSAQSIAGPISVYAGDITVSGNLNTSAGGATGTVLLKATGNITQSSGIDLTTDGADVIYWADSDDNSSGYITFGSTGGQDIITNGGDVIMAGGAGTTVPTGYADGGTVAAGINFPIATTRAVINTTKTSAIGGDIILRGKTTGAFDGIYTQNIQFFGHNLTLDGSTVTSANYGVRLGSTNVYNGTNLSQVIDIDNDLTITAINTAASYAGNALRTGVNPRV